VQDATGGKIIDLDRIQEIKGSLIAAVDRYVHQSSGWSEAEARIASPT
jgi:hypothetical protein